MIDTVTTNDYPRLLVIWESAVKSTHDFLKTEDFEFYKVQMPAYFEHLELYAYKDEHGNINGFLGIDGRKVEMLFVDNAFRGKGIGKVLLAYAVNTLKADRLDVNEQNTRAVGFYNYFGFRIAGRSAVDGEGKNYPILHLEWHNPE